MIESLCSIEFAIEKIYQKLKCDLMEIERQKWENLRNENWGNSSNNHNFPLAAADTPKMSKKYTFLDREVRNSL